MSISPCIARWRPEGGPADATPRSSCGPREQCAQPDQVVGCPGEGHDPVDELSPAVPQLPQAADGFHPAEDLLDQFPLPLTDGVARMPRSAGVDPRSGVLLGHMWGDPALTHGPDKSSNVEMLVAADGGRPVGLLEQ